jgi:hypothetical protein
MLELMNGENISSNIFLSFLSNKSLNGFHFLILPVSVLFCSHLKQNKIIILIIKIKNRNKMNVHTGILL